MNILVLFSGTGSIEKVYDDEEKHDIRGVDLDNTFKPFYNVNILEWEYKDVFNDWVPDYIHGSPVCKEFSNMKHGHNRNIGLGTSLLNKTLEIIKYVQTLNSKLKYTIENPKGLMRKLECMKEHKRVTTSYCKYDFLYKKETDFWFGGFELELRPVCRRTKDQSNWCEGMKELGGQHKVRLGVSRNSKTHFLANVLQLPDNEYFKQLKIDNPEYKGYSNTYFRYRIPEDLCKEIKDCVLK